jgi:hypothetical protein
MEYLVLWCSCFDCAAGAGNTGSSYFHNDFTPDRIMASSINSLIPSQIGML